MIRVEKSTDIARPSEEVFAFVSDQTNAARGNPASSTSGG